MGTVLHDRSVQDMKAFYLSHGECTPFVRNNEAATIQWVEELQKNMDSEYDRQPLELALWIINIVPLDRPTAPQVVTTIFNFDGGRPFYCDDCDSSNNTTQVVCQEADVKELHHGYSNDRRSPPGLLDNEAEQVSEPKVHKEDSTDNRFCDERTACATFQGEFQESQTISLVLSQVQDNGQRDWKLSTPSETTVMNKVSTFDCVKDVSSPCDVLQQLDDARIAPPPMSNHRMEQKTANSRNDSSSPVEAPEERAQALYELPTPPGSPQTANVSSNAFPYTASASRSLRAASPPFSMPPQTAGRPPSPLTPPLEPAWG